ncbi:MAG: LamG-like jellyroll fold domain-containing protein [Opitutaceae bacterium]|nr:LamG-like jellyroll fold domain-containing protein [Opitutaceae bacterium]
MKPLAQKRPEKMLAALAALALMNTPTRAETVALWLFDEQAGAYPSSVLNDAGPRSYFLILGRGAELVPGRFGNALRPIVPPPLAVTYRSSTEGGGGVAFGLRPPPSKPGRTQPPLMWENAHFAALFTNGDAHLRRAPFANATDSKLNLGENDWTVEGWLRLEAAAKDEGVIFELGSGPRGENELVTRLTVLPAENAFAFTGISMRAPPPSLVATKRIEFPNPAGPPAGVAHLQTITLAPRDLALPRDTWMHVALVHVAASDELRLFVDGRTRAVAAAAIDALPHGDEAYVSVGRDGKWGRPWAGAIDELRISDHAVYQADFAPPGSFSRMHGKALHRAPPIAGPPLLFGPGEKTGRVIELGSRRHLFLDDALLAKRENISLVPHPARMAERVLQGSGWISVVDAGPDDIRLYANGPDNTLAVFTSKDGVNFGAPDLGHDYRGRKNIVVTDPASVGTVFIDRNGPPDERWKIVTGLRDRGGIFVYTSPDGFVWRRHETAALPFWAGSAVNVFYDDQRQRYVIHNRTDYYRTPGGTTNRKSLLTEVTDLLQPWPFRRVSADDTRAATARGGLTRATELDPWWLDNGPLAPGGFGLEYPIAFEADAALDPIGTDVYNTRAQKYPWADDAYVAFPLFFFHYHRDGPPQRQVLADPAQARGSGLVETQLAVSRNGLGWTRYPRPAYVGIGDEDGYAVRRSYVGHGLVRRGRQLWQYSYTRSTYHDAYEKATQPDTIHRLVQRVDGFVSADAPYTGGAFTTKPLRFQGNRLRLNVDTDAAGYLQIGFLDEHGAAIPGFSVDDCVYVNGDEIDYEVEWLGPGKDVGALAGRVVQLVARMRGTSLYALQFVKR